MRAAVAAWPTWTRRGQGSRPTLVILTTPPRGFATTCPSQTCPPNDQDKLPGRLQRRHLSKSRDAGPVNFIGLILIMVSFGMGRGLSQGYTGGIRAQGMPWPKRGIFRKDAPSNHDAGSGPRTHAKGDHDALL